MERNAQLAAAGRAVAGALILLACGLAIPRPAGAQCGTGATDGEIRPLVQQHKWAEAAARAAAMPSRVADVDFDYGLALGHLERWNDARAALEEGWRACPREERFAIELAGVDFEQKNYAGAAAWLRRGLRLDATNTYALNFAGAVYYVVGNLDAALKYWNRVGKPYLASLRIDPQVKADRLLVERAFAFSPAEVLQRDDLAATRERLEGLGIFPTFGIALRARPDGQFDAEFRALERDGFGHGKAQALVATLGGLPYETVYPSYYNTGRAAINVESLLRWDEEKRRAWIAVSAPLRHMPQGRWQLATDERAENWVVRPSFTGPAPALGSLRLERAAIAGTITQYASGRTTWWMGGEISHRTFSQVEYGSALNAAMTSGGYEIKPQAAIERKIVDVPERRLTATVRASSELARLWPAKPSLFEKLQGSARMRWQPGMSGDKYEWTERVRAGRIFGSAPFDELWMLGVERDNDLWLRGLIGTRDRRKGSSPLGSGYVLANSDFDRRVYANGLIAISAGPLFDVGRAWAPTPGLASHEWLASAGAEVRLKVLGSSVVVTYGRDLRAGTNAVYGAAGIREQGSGDRGY